MTDLPDAPDLPHAPDPLYADTLAHVLELEELDRNLFRGRNTVTARSRTMLYGGQVAAQALMAAGRTVAADRVPHSLHGYFLRAGQIDRPVILRVDSDRDGGSFSARHVSAVQDGEVIFSMLASFHAGEPETVVDRMQQPEVPGPEHGTPRVSDELIEVSEIARTIVTEERRQVSDCMWVRAASALPEDRLTQCCALTYLTDLGAGFGQLVDVVGNSGASLDHAVWFHEPVRAEQWLLLHLWPRKATTRRGLYEGTVRDRSGRLAAVVSQEQLLRPRP